MCRWTQGACRRVVAVSGMLVALTVIFSLPRANADTPATEAKPLRYQWQADQTHGYHFTIEARIENSTYSTTGLCNYQVDTSLGVQAAKAKAKGSGTAFVVDPRGILMTAAHVIDEATSVIVKLDGKNYVAHILEIDRVKDIALLKIDVNGLPVLTLADSDRVELGEVVWSLGYPLSDVLGSSLKINSGMISGLSQTKEGKLFQVDASLNPGNSGGPIFNEFGHVVGVAIRKLNGPAITDVGFTCPINESRALLKQAGAALAPRPTSMRKLDGPSLVAATQRSIALVEVESDPTRDSTKLTYVTTYSTRKSSSQRDSGGAVPGMIPAYARRSSSSYFGDYATPKMVHGKLTVTSYGDVTDASEEDQLPFSFSSSGVLAIDCLDPDGKAEWSTRKKTTIAQLDEEERKRSPYDWMESPIPGLYRERPTRPKVTVYDAVEEADYKVVQRDAETTRIAKSYVLKTSDHEKWPYMEVTGEIQIVFNQKEGQLESSTGHFEIAHRISSNITVHFPVDIRVNRTSAEAIAATKKKEAEAAAVNAVEMEKTRERMAAAETERRRDKVKKLAELPQPSRFRRIRHFEITDVASTVKNMFVSDDGTRVVIVDNRGVVTMHDPAQPEPVKRLEGFAGFIELVEFSGDGKLLLIAMHDKTMLINLESSESTNIPKRDSYFPRTAAFSSDGKAVYLAYPSHGIDKFNIANSELTKFCKEEEFDVDMVVAADGSKLYVCVRDDVKTWDTRTGKLLKSVNLDRGSRNSYTDMKLSSSGIGLYQGSETTDVYRLDKATKFAEIPERSRSECCSITNDGKTAAFAISYGGNVAVWDIQGKKSIDLFQVDTASVTNVSLSPNGKFLLTVGYDKIVQLWERKEAVAKEKK